MNNTVKELEEQIKQLEEKLVKTPKKKWQVLRLIFVGIFFPFVGPYIPFRTGTLAERMGYNKSALLFGAIFLIAVPVGCIMHIQKIDFEINDIEVDLELLKRKKQLAEKQLEK